jgi:hypothetical protein
MQTQRRSLDTDSATKGVSRSAGRPALRRLQLGFRPAVAGGGGAPRMFAPIRRWPQPSVASMGRLRSIRLSLRFIAPLAITLALLAYGLVPLVDRLTLRWWVNDLDTR